MKKISTINDRVLQIIDIQFNGNQKKFAEFIGVAPQVISNIVSGRKSKPSYDVINSILSSFVDLDASWLITGNGSRLKNDNSLLLSDIESKVPQVVTVSPHQKDNIVLVPVRAQAGYLTGYNDPAFIEKLPTYSLPGIQNGIFRMFQVSGFSMYPTLQNNSYVVGQFVEDWLNLSDNRVYVVVTKEHGVIVKRVLNRINKYGNLYCKSDNRDYPNIPVSPEDVKEIWECKMQLSFEFLDPSDVYQKISNLEADVEMLKNELKGKEHGK
ncbi:S24 family peptidase [Riemerella anatipestifer]|nr:S24 family peptidase [Riemerella anatipestifer]